MKNSFKLAVLALAISVAAVACKGKSSTDAADSAKMDSSKMMDSAKMDTSKMMDSAKMKMMKDTGKMKMSKDTTKKM